MSRLPNFLYIGPDKAGSSWLHEMLIRHPDVYLTPAKDLYFFDRYYDRGPGVVRRAVPGRDRARPSSARSARTTCSTRRARERIADVLGDRPRLMVSPARPGGARLVLVPLRAQARHRARRTSAPRCAREPALLEHGRYASGLERFAAALPPRPACTSRVFDDLAADPQAFLDATTDFLGVDRHAAGRGRPRRPGCLPPRARSTAVAHAARRAADWVREHDGARLVGRGEAVPAGAARPLPADRQDARSAPTPTRWPTSGRSSATRSTGSSATTASRCARGGAGRDAGDRRRARSCAGHLVEPVGRPSSGAAVPPRRRHRSSSASTIDEYWPLTVYFYLYPLWWVLGVSKVMIFVLAVPMLAALLRHRTIRVPRGVRRLPAVPGAGWGSA